MVWYPLLPTTSQTYHDANHNCDRISTCGARIIIRVRKKRKLYNEFTNRLIPPPLPEKFNKQMELGSVALRELWI